MSDSGRKEKSRTGENKKNTFNFLMKIAVSL